MPCLNEAATLERCIGKALSFFEKHGVNGEVVIGDNGSTDGSQAIARSCGARVVEVPVEDMARRSTTPSLLLKDVMSFSEIPTTATTSRHSPRSWRLCAAALNWSWATVS